MWYLQVQHLLRFCGINLLIPYLNEETVLAFAKVRVTHIKFTSYVGLLKPLETLQLWTSITNIGFLTLKEPGYFDPSHSRRGADSAPLKILETDRWNIKCVVLVDSYDPPESIGTKEFKTYLVWRHSDVISDVMLKTRKSPKIAKIMVFRYFFKQKLHFVSNDVCQSMLTHVLTPNKPNK